MEQGLQRYPMAGAALGGRENQWSGKVVVVVIAASHQETLPTPASILPPTEPNTTTEGMLFQLNQA